MYTLPLSLIPYLGWATVPVMIATFWAFVSIQEIGHFIEEPFNKSLELLSLGQFVTLVRQDLSGILNSTNNDNNNLKLLMMVQFNSIQIIFYFEIRFIPNSNILFA